MSITTAIKNGGPRIVTATVHIYRGTIAGKYKSRSSAATAVAAQLAWPDEEGCDAGFFSPMGS